MARQIKLHFGKGKLFGHERMPKKFGRNLEKISDTSYIKCHSGQNRRRNTGELFLKWPRKCLGIYDQDMTQTIYENYLGILGVMEIKVAAQPRAI